MGVETYLWSIISHLHITNLRFLLDTFLNPLCTWAFLPTTIPKKSLSCLSHCFDRTGFAIHKTTQKTITLDSMFQPIINTADDMFLGWLSAPGRCSLSFKHFYTLPKTFKLIMFDNIMDLSRSRQLFGLNLCNDDKKTDTSVLILVYKPWFPFATGTWYPQRNDSIYRTESILL